MHRIEVINTLIKQRNATMYVEIGVCRGDVLDKVTCKTKIGVDPHFLFSKELRLKRLLGLSKFRTYPYTSDRFFDKYADRVLTNGIDIALVDGLHTCKQAQRDIENCLSYLNDGGVIVVHDCNPHDAAAAYPVKASIQEVLDKVKNWELPGWQGQWNGDVWKTIANLIRTRQDLRIFTLDMDFGLGIIMKGEPEHTHNFTAQEIEDNDYAFFDQHRRELINLKPPKYFFEVFKPNQR